MFDPGPLAETLAAIERSTAPIRRRLAEMERQMEPLRQTLERMSTVGAAMQASLSLASPEMRAVQERLAASSSSIAEALRKSALSSIRLELGSLSRVDLTGFSNASATLNEAIAGLRAVSALELGPRWEAVSQALLEHAELAVSEGGELDIVEVAADATETALSAKPFSFKASPIFILHLFFTFLVPLLQIAQGLQSSKEQSARHDEEMAAHNSIRAQLEILMEYVINTRLIATRPVHIRNGPSAGSPSVAKLGEGARLFVLQSDGRWLNVVHQTDDSGEVVIGWVYKRHLRPVPYGEDHEEDE